VYGTAEYEKGKVQWERYDRVPIMVMNDSINPAIIEALPKTPSSAKGFMIRWRNPSKILQR
jgi:hypothetical protein